MLCVFQPALCLVCAVRDVEAWTIYHHVHDIQRCLFIYDGVESDAG